ncbi:MAG TPA: hypothetical protein VFG04_02085 [Planctomycetaceae bacterium]|jgi:hypothetical protein|nr:hypothetical protein [Planctomycetaceae bacterium]
MAKAIRIVLGILIASTLAGGLLVAVELFSAVVYPMPPDSTNTKEEVCAHVAAYPHWILAVVVPAWSGTALASTWVATRLGGRVAGIVVALLFLAAIVMNLSMLPYTLWFKVTMLICAPLACLLGVGLPRRPPVAPGMAEAFPAQ